MGQVEIMDKKLEELFDIFVEYKDETEVLSIEDNIENFKLAIEDRLRTLKDKDIEKENRIHI